MYKFVLIMMLSLMDFPAYAQSETNLSGDWDSFKNAVTEFRQAQKIPGLAVGVVRSGELVGSVGLGYADNNRTLAVTPDTPFWIASVTKTFVGLAYLHLVQEEEVSLNEVAANTPGFDRLCRWLASTSIPFAKGLNCDAKITIGHILHHQVNDPPGSQFMYNPIMYSRLSRHLEHKFGEGIDAVEGRHNYLGRLIDRKILEPAQMKRTMASMWDRSKLDVYFDVAEGYVVDDEGRKQKLPFPDRHIPGGAGIVSNINDLVKYERAISSGLIIPDGGKEMLLNPAHFSNKEPSPYGFGWYFQCYRGVKLMWHGGWDPDHGYSAIYLRVPDQKLALIALANSEGGLWWGNSLTEPQVEKSRLAKMFLDTFVEFSDEPDQPDCGF